MLLYVMKQRDKSESVLTQMCHPKFFRNAADAP